MKLSILFSIILLSNVGFIGCSKKALNNDIIIVKAESPNLQTAIIEENSNFNDHFENISPIAYDHYVMALLLESEDPPDLIGASKHYKLALKSYPNSHQLIYSLANTYMSLRFFSESLELLGRIKPADKKVLQLQADAYRQLNIHDSAKYTYEKLAKLDPNEPTSYHFLSGYYNYANNVDSLIWAYENLARLIPFNENYWQELGKLKAQKGQFNDSKEDFLKSIEVNNSATNILSYVGLAEMYKIERKIDSVLITYKRVLEVDSTNAALYADISMVYAQLDSLEKAIPYAKKAVIYNPQDLLGFRRLGIMYFGTQQFDSAETVFTEIVNRGDSNYLNHFYLGRIAAQQNNYKIAVDEFKIMVQLNDTIPEHWLDLGYAYQKLDDFQHEILSYQSGITKVTNDNARIKLLFALGATYEHEKMLDSAINTFGKILSLDSEHHQAMNYLGYMLVEKNEQLPYAKKLIEKAMKLEPNNAAYTDSYGWLFYKTKDYKNAVKHLKVAAELKDDPIVFEHLGDAYYAKGEINNAMEWWAKALELNPDSETLKNKMK